MYGNASEKARNNFDWDINILQNENASLRLINENLSKTNQELSVQVTAERQRNSEVWKRIHSLDGSVGNLMQFKESLFNMKQQLDPKLKPCEHKSVQTWKNYICRSCVKFSQIYHYFEEPDSYKEQFDITDCQRRKLCDIQEAVTVLKTFLAEREDGIDELLDAYDASEQLIMDLKSEIKNLKDMCITCKKHNIQLTDELKMKDKDIKMFKDIIQSLSKMLSDLDIKTRDSTLTRGGDETKDILLDTIVAIINPLLDKVPL